MEMWKKKKIEKSKEKCRKYYEKKREEGWCYRSIFPPSSVFPPEKWLGGKTTIGAL
jgi:hypothetical protein